MLLALPFGKYFLKSVQKGTVYLAFTCPDVSIEVTLPLIGNMSRES